MSGPGMRDAGAMSATPHPAQPPAPPPADRPVAAAPAPSRVFGWVVLVGALMWMLMVALLVLAFGSAAWATMIGISQVTTPTPDGEQQAREALAVGAATGVGALALAVFSLVLDGVTAVLSLRRLDGRRGDRAVPVIALLAVAVALVLPVLLAGLALLASLVDLTQITAALLWLLVAVLLALAPAARLAQGIAGLVRVITGEPSRPAVGALP